MFISENTVIQNDVPDSCYFSVLPQSSNNSDIIEQESVFVRYFFYFIYLIAFTTAEKKGCGGGRTTEQGSKLSAPFLPSQPWYTTEDRPQHRELHALLFSTNVWVLLRPTGILTLKGCETGPAV